MGRHRQIEAIKINRARTEIPIKDRLDWAREQWRKDPSISVNGRRGMSARMMEVFGVAAAIQQLQEVHAEIAAETRAAMKAEKEARREKAAEPFNSIKFPSLAVEKARPHDSVERAPARSADTPPPPKPAAPPPMAPVIAIRKADPPPVAVVAQPEAPQPPAPRPPPAPVVAPPAPPAAPVARGSMAGRSKSSEDTAIRLAYARSIATPTMKVNELLHHVRERFFWGIDTRTACDILSEMRGGKRRADFKGTPAPAPVLDEDENEDDVIDTTELDEEEEAAAPAPMPRPVPRPAPRLAACSSAAPAPRRLDLVEDQIRAAMELLFDEAPALKELHVTRGPDGRPSVEWEIAVVSKGRLAL